METKLLCIFFFSIVSLLSLSVHLPFFFRANFRTLHIVISQANDSFSGWIQSKNTHLNCFVLFFFLSSSLYEIQMEFFVYFTLECWLFSFGSSRMFYPFEILFKLKYSFFVSSLFFEMTGLRFNDILKMNVIKKKRFEAYGSKAHFIRIFFKIFIKNL